MAVIQLVVALTAHCDCSRTRRWQPNKRAYCDTPVVRTESKRIVLARGRSTRKRSEEGTRAQRPTVVEAGHYVEAPSGDGPRT